MCDTSETLHMYKRSSHLFGSKKLNNISKRSNNKQTKTMSCIF
ncbi:hypothetical protein N476_22710 [Pseudoalteromonas luteoviolacea H33]|uniref:Uncharacterized protein n=1 Tax=Pseudoalteromonas luteoviolacea H33 TaxID=1365251 RepID=A0A161XX34_9GAMM|nr:hypothetical protein N476_22710 [Pseudoalteromonas luteoviolacea H33]KZN74627.1 hypothetical protein N477_21605 [Pseudoalteromonas luteoviolacea H33-S]